MRPRAFWSITRYERLFLLVRLVAIACIAFGSAILDLYQSGLDGLSLTSEYHLE